jgi:hypothetical protein
VALGTAVFGFRRRNDPLRAVTFFFAAAVIALFLKRYGSGLVNWIGALPYLSLVNFAKYEEALMSISVAVLAAIGIERLRTRNVPKFVRPAAWLCTAALLPLAAYLSQPILTREITQLHVPYKLVHLSFALPIGLLLALPLMLIACWLYERSEPTSNRASICMATLLCAEMCTCFLAPVYYWFNRLPEVTHNPYAGAPYINELRKDQGHYRTFARDGLLFPNWASVFRIYDIRNLDAMYDRKYLPFLLNFLPDQKNTPPPLDLGDRFNGTGPYDLTNERAKRLLQLSSVKYIATIRAFTTPNRMVDEILAQNLGHLTPGREANVVRKEFVLGDEARDAVGEHPPYDRMPYRLTVPAGPNAIFHFSYALDPFVYDKAGDGVEFILELKDRNGKITKLFSAYIDPKHNPAERRWMEDRVDLSSYRGQPIDLLLTTTPGPKGDSGYDWAAWSGFYFEGHRSEVQGQAPPFKLIYNGEDARIYSYENVLPRAAVYYRTVLASGENDALAKLADPKLDIFDTVVLESSRLTPAERAQIATINAHPAARMQPAAIASYTSQRVVIDAAPTRTGILVLNDTDYPGWAAYIDGKPAHWVNANYMFRGLLLPPGKHVITFKYQPSSFYSGIALSGLTLAVLITGAFVAHLRRPKATPQPTPVAAAVG